jgi:gliding motility-associated-like protein
VVSPSSTTNYTVIGENLGCTNTQTTQVVIIPQPTISVNSSTICSGQSATLIANGASSYTWNTGATSNSIVVSPSSNTNYTVTGEISGCSNSQTTSVFILSAPTITLIPDANTICKNNCVTISYAPSTFTDITFDYGDGNGYTPFNSYCFTSTGIHTISAQGTFTNGCHSVAVPISINVIDNPVADFSVSPQFFVNDNVVITNLSSGANLYNWNFGDGNSLITYSYNINHSYSSSGRYCILLTAIDTVFLCSDTVTKCINVEDNFIIEIPNIFTPNLDGVNDEFKVRAKGVKEFHCEIYDRWGIKLYEWDDISKGWNGYLKNNSKAPTGTYYYIIKCVLNNGEIKEFKGYLTLLE